MLTCNARRWAAYRAARATELKAQRGFSLIEIALGLAVMGVLIGMTLKSQELLEQYRQSQFVTQVQTLVANARAHRSALGRWPGDCNRDGLVDYAFNTTETLESGEDLDYAEPTSLDAAATEVAPYPYSLGNVCPVTTLLPFDDVNVAFNELKRASLTPAGEPNRKSANHRLGGFAYLVNFDTGFPSDPLNLLEQQFNALVLTDVSIQAARRLATAIDGHNGSAGNTGRVRRWDNTTVFAPLWTADGETDLARITVVVFFDRIPP
jgi:prepilin-type N-terminal cleavage/methylation domain-containing protein